MWLVYLLALVVGGGLLFVQLVSGGHDAHGGGHPGDVQHHGAGPGLVSVRSAIYGLFAFGFVGAALRIPGLTSKAASFLIALASGIATTLAAGYTFSRLGSVEASGAASLGDAVGRRARVLIPCSPERPGKIRVEIGGQQVDMTAVCSGSGIAAGTDVVVIAVEENMARVAPATRGGTS
jgi:membrane protein implicated in regulation of membrane protease activity